MPANNDPTVIGADHPWGASSRPDPDPNTKTKKKISLRRRTLSGSLRSAVRVVLVVARLAAIAGCWTATCDTSTLGLPFVVPLCIENATTRHARGFEFRALLGAGALPFFSREALGLIPSGSTVRTELRRPNRLALTRVAFTNSLTTSQPPRLLYRVVAGAALSTERTRPLTIRHRIFWCIAMPLGTVGLSRVHRRESNAAQRVLAIGDWIKVRRIDAERVSTPMIELRRLFRNRISRRPRAIGKSVRGG